MTTTTMDVHVDDVGATNYPVASAEEFIFLAPDAFLLSAAPRENGDSAKYGALHCERPRGENGAVMG